MRASYTALQDAAKRLLMDTQTDVSQQVRVSTLARMLSDAEHCSYDQARRAIARAVRIARGEKVRTWGGHSAGGSPPTTAVLREGAECLVTLNGESLGTGTIAVARHGTIRLAVITFARGGELRIAVEK